MSLLSRRAVLALLAASACTRSESAPPVVATFSILADMARQVAGDRIAIVSIVGPDADAHLFDARPSDVAHVSDAALVIENGLTFEPWAERLRAAARYDGLVCVASEDVEPITMNGAPDPHAWHDVANARLYAKAISDALIDAFPADRAHIEARYAVYDQRLETLDEDIRAALGSIPTEQRVVVTSHASFAYFGRAYGVRFVSPIGLTTQEGPTPARVAGLIDLVRREGVRALFLENMVDPRLLHTIAAETQVAIGGRLFSDALTDASGPAPTYEALMRTNLNALASALAPRPAR